MIDLRLAKGDKLLPVFHVSTCLHISGFRSGYSLKDTVNFAQQIESMMRQTLGVDADEQVEEEEEITDEEPPEEDEDDEEEEEDDEEEEEDAEEDAPKDEL